MSAVEGRTTVRAESPLLERAYAVLLRSYPAEFRDRYGAEMTQAFRDGCTAQLRWRNPFGGALFLGGEIAGGLRNGARERRRRRAERLLLRTPHGAGNSPPPRVRSLPSLLDDLRTDLRLALRGLRRDPAFAAVAIGTLALGVGVSVAVFGLYHTLLGRSLAGLTPDARLVRVLFHGDRPYNFYRISAPNYRDLAATTEQFETTTAYRSYPGQHHHRPSRAFVSKPRDGARQLLRHATGWRRCRTPLAAGSRCR